MFRPNKITRYGATVGELNDSNLFNIFDKPYSLYNNNKPEFEENFIDKYYNYVPEDHNVDEFKRKLYFKLRTLNNKYENLYRLSLVKIDPTNQFKTVERYESLKDQLKNLESDTTQDSMATSNANTSAKDKTSTSATNKNESESNDFNLTNDTPTIKSEDYRNDNDYASGISKNDSKIKNESESGSVADAITEAKSDAISKALAASKFKEKMNDIVKEEFTKTIEGSSMTTAEYMLKVIDAFIDIDNMFLEEFRPLFSSFVGSWR